MAQTDTTRLAPTPELVGDERTVLPGRAGQLYVDRQTRFSGPSVSISRNASALVGISDAGLLLADSDVAAQVCPDAAAELDRVSDYE